MLNAVNNIFRVFAVVGLAAIMLTSCGESKEEKAAKELLAQAVTCLGDGNYREALEIVDTIPALYPKQIKVRAAALNMKPAIIEELTREEMLECENEMTRVMQEFEQAREKMKRVENPELVEGYWIPSGFKQESFMSSTGIQPRVNDDGSFNIISEVNGAGSLHHSSFVLSAADGDEASSGTVAYDNELNYRINNSETVTYSDAHVDTIGAFALKHAGQPLQLTFIGENGKTKKIQLTAKDTQGIADAYMMSKLQKEGKMLVAKRKLLERKYELAQEQQRRTKKGAE